MAEALDIKKQKYSFKGTPNWMAPEIVKNLDYSRFSDIWGLGCTLIEMATGEPPYCENKNPLAALYMLYNITSPPKIPEHLSDNCKHFISSCLK
jgi:serine/threonine protein kinase